MRLVPEQGRLHPGTPRPEHRQGTRSRFTNSNASGCGVSPAPETLMRSIEAIEVVASRLLGMVRLSEVRRGSPIGKGKAFGASSW
jgi:hypothetical protein